MSTRGSAGQAPVAGLHTQAARKIIKKLLARARACAWLLPTRARWSQAGLAWNACPIGVSSAADVVSAAL